MELASKHPDLSFVVQDFGSVEPQFQTTVGPELKGRITFQEHNFFTPQPVKDADVYMLKHVLHDWPDAVCATIIQQIIPVMKKGSRIIVVDGIQPEFGQVPNYVMKVMASLDLTMMGSLNAKERTKADWEAVAKLADSRLIMEAFNQPPGSAFGAISFQLKE